MWVIQTPTEKMYVKAIQGFLTDPKQFESFKRHRLYSSVIGTPTIKQMFGFYNKLKEDGDVFLKLLDFAKADEVGGPWLYSFEGNRLSANTIRYANSIQLLKRYFGSLDNKHILEFGGGWGGLAWCIHQMWTPAKYSIVDLPEAEQLAVKHSEKLGLKISTGMPSYKWDLFIAEFSLTEQTGDELYQYTKDYLLPSKEIWIRCNIFDEPRRIQWIDYLKQHYDITELREDPDVLKMNSIIIGRKK